LSELQKILDSQGLEIVENQKEGMVGRKKLAEQTRGQFQLELTELKLIPFTPEFKKVADEDKGPAFKTLLKGHYPHPRNGNSS